MKGIVALCILAALVSPTLYAQHAGEQQITQQSRQNIQQNMNRGALNSTLDQGRVDRQLWANSLANQAKLRKKLAEAWQALGMSPQGAEVVASAYHPELAGAVYHVSLHGKSDQEVSTMLQSALAKKNYQLANQLLIGYEQARASLGSSTAQNGVR
jgi:hypothetical protein